MMEALTVRGLQDTDTIKPENLKSETEDRNSKSRSRLNLSKDHDGGSDPERTSRDRHDQARGWEIRERKIVNRRRKLEILFTTESKQRSWWRLWPQEHFKRQTRSSQRTGNPRMGNRKPKMETQQESDQQSLKGQVQQIFWELQCYDVASEHVITNIFNKANSF